MRPPNIITAVSDVLAGIAMAGTLVFSQFDISTVIFLVFSTAFLYGGGVVLNDAGVQNQLSFVADRWKSPASPGNGIVQRAIRNDYAFGISNTSRYLFDGSFVKNA